MQIIRFCQGLRLQNEGYCIVASLRQGGGKIEDFDGGSSPLSKTNSPINQNLKYIKYGSNFKTAPIYLRIIFYCCKLL